VAIGDAATAAGYPLVPETGEEGKVKWGSREFNRTRDMVAGLKTLIPSSKDTARTAAGISSGTSDPAGGTDGDIYFKILP
jgi:acetyl-CoA acetyltransferase